MFQYQRLDSGDTSEWSEWVLSRINNRFVLQHNIRITGTKSPYCYVSKSMADSIIASNDPNRFQKAMDEAPCKYFELTQ